MTDLEQAVAILLGPAAREIANQLPDDGIALAVQEIAPGLDDERANYLALIIETFGWKLLKD